MVEMVEHGKWIKPSSGWHKINTDGSVLTHRQSAACGGILRDEEGNWILGFTRKLGDLSVTVAELLGAREGLALAWDRCIPRIELEIDSEVVVKLIRDANVNSHPLGCLIEDCRRLLGMPWESRVIHTRRSGNICADALAKLGHDLLEGATVWEEAPSTVLPLLLEDRL